MTFKGLARKLDYASKIIGAIVLSSLAIVALYKGDISSLVWVAVVGDLAVRTTLDGMSLYLERK